MFPDVKSPKFFGGVELTDHTGEVLAAYKLWLDCARREAKSADALNRQISSQLPRLSEISQATVRGWTNPKTLKLPRDIETGQPNWPAIEAIDKGVTHFVKEPPLYDCEIKVFRDLLLQLRQLRSQNQEAGKHTHETYKSLYDKELLGRPAVKVRDLDPLELNLGSYLFSGGLPPYTARSIDHELLKKLNDPDEDLVTVVGEPKVGKTRTLIENLKVSALKDCSALWLKPGSNFETIIKNLNESNRTSVVFIIDDLQRWIGESGSLTVKSLSDLKARGKVLVTLHQEDLQKWKLQNIDHSSDAGLMGSQMRSATPSERVLQELENSALHLPASLTEAELEEAHGIFKDSESHKLKFLGSYLSSTEYLMSKITSAGSGNDTTKRAIVIALADAKILYPNGFTISQLQELTQFELNELIPNAFFSQASFELSISNYFTVGASPTTPHSIIQKSVDNPNTYSLFDPLWTVIKPKVWSAPEFLVARLDLLELAELAKNSGYADEAFRLLCLPVRRKSRAYFRLFAEVNLALGNRPQAIDSYRKAIEMDDDFSRMGLGFLLVDSDKEESLAYFETALANGNLFARNSVALGIWATDPPRCRTLLEELAREGDNHGSFNLGLLLHFSEPDRAEQLYEYCITLGNAGAMNNYSILIEAKDPEYSRELRHRAANLGDTAAMTNIAERFIPHEIPHALPWLSKASELGHSRAKAWLGHLNFDSDPENCLDLLESSAEMGDDYGRYFLSRRLEKIDANRSRELRELFLTTANGGAVFDIALRMEQWWEGENFLEYLHLLDAASQLGDADATLELALQCEESEPEKALALLERASGLKHPEAMNSLALLIEERDPARSRNLLLEAKGLGSTNATFNLGLTFMTTDTEKARFFFQELADLGDKDAQALLREINKDSPNAKKTTKSGKQTKTQELNRENAGEPSTRLKGSRVK